MCKVSRGNKADINMNDVICFRNDILVHKEQDVVWPQCQ